MALRKAQDLDVGGKRVFVRVDFNVPQDDQRRVTDDTRIRAALPTIELLRGRGAQIILASHLGRPRGQANPRYSLAPVAERLRELLPGVPVTMAPDCVGPAAEEAAASLRPGDVLLLENLRFHAGEEKNDPAFAAALARLADVYVDDAFGAAHRAHASTEGLARLLPSAAGLLMQREVEALADALERPERPFITVIGGAKISDKIGVLQNLADKVDALIVGGGMANTFLLARGLQLGDSLMEPDKLDEARTIEHRCHERGVRLLLPTDAVVADRVAADAQRRVVPITGVAPGWRVLDIGPETARAYAAAVQEAHTVIWNGPMGVFELAPFAEGTRAVAQAMGRVKGTTIVGGGDSVAAVEQMGLAGAISHISTGGGASLEFLEGRRLPGVAVLEG